MSHEPPVPPGNTSPFPKQEAPHPPAPPKPPKKDKASSPTGRSIGIILGAAAAIGFVAVGAAALLAPRRPAKKSRAKRKK